MKKIYLNKINNNVKIFIFALVAGWITVSCDSYVDVVPDNVATINNAFTDRNQAEKFLFTLYAYMPNIGHPQCVGRYDDMTWASRGSDDLFQWYSLYAIRDGNRTLAPYCNYWEGGYGATFSLYQGIHDCNVFIEKIDEARDLDPVERARWVAEAKFLKAYYHFFLLQLYGPIPVIEQNLPITASQEEVMVPRKPVDDVFGYIYTLIDEAVSDLPPKIEDVTLEMGRLSQPAALAMKAKIAVTAASPLFNGNTTYSGFTDRQGKPFFNQQEDSQKWTFAAECCKIAIESCINAGHDLYTFDGTLTSLSPETEKIVQVGRIITDKWNKEHIWSLTASNSRLDECVGAALTTNHAWFRGVINPTLKAAEMFYTKNGLPIDEDKTYDYEHRYDIVTTTVADNKYLQTGVQTVKLHLDREYRFYGTLGVDGGWWYGLGNYGENAQWPLNIKSGGASGIRGSERYPCTGMYIKKLISMESTFNNTSYVMSRYDNPIMRLADLYLLYAEALNETLGAPNTEVFEYLNRVRNRTGLANIQDAYLDYAKDPGKYQTKTGMRDIIRRERSIELAFESNRFFDIRRWNTATEELNGPIQGWNYFGKTAIDFYQIVVVDNVSYTDRDVLWPIRTVELAKNRNLVQNPGWQ
jgi:hypothetical protein